VILGLMLLVIVMFQPTGLIGFFVSDRERVGSFGRPSQQGRQTPHSKEPERVVP